MQPPAVDAGCLPTEAAWCLQRCGSCIRGRERQIVWASRGATRWCLAGTPVRREILALHISSTLQLPPGQMPGCPVPPRSTPADWMPRPALVVQVCWLVQRRAASSSPDAGPQPPCMLCRPVRTRWVCLAARSLASWLPPHHHPPPPLAATHLSSSACVPLLFFLTSVTTHLQQTAVVFGHGNVAIDVARMLVTPVDMWVSIAPMSAGPSPHD